MQLLNYITDRGYTVTVLVSPDHPDARNPTARVQAKHGPHCFRWRTLNGRKLHRAHKDRPPMREVRG
ncbi:hypothetical protein [Novispirillum itersonii]|uniref:hypothetical protein n=1 Tax=Novispirillum itersonii TaxID=189 RepID=UPI00035CB1D2|nr:hypothetical protein [Novispirillum itersonii]